MRKTPIYWFLGLLFLLALGVIGYVLITTPEGHWMVVAAGMQGLATIGLVWVTTQYAGLVEKQAVASEEAAEATRDSSQAAQRAAEAAEHRTEIQAREEQRIQFRLTRQIKRASGELRLAETSWAFNIDERLGELRDSIGTDPPLPYDREMMDSVAEAATRVADDDLAEAALEAVSHGEEVNSLVKRYALHVDAEGESDTPEFFDDPEEMEVEIRDSFSNFGGPFGTVEDSAEGILDNYFG